MFLAIREYNSVAEVRTIRAAAFAGMLLKGN